MSIKTRDQNLSDEKQKQLEMLSEHLVKTPDTIGEAIETIDELEDEKVDLEAELEDLESDLEDEKLRADINFDKYDNECKAHELTEEKLDKLTDRVEEVISWLENAKKDVSIEDVIKQLEWALKIEGDEMEED